MRALAADFGITDIDSIKVHYAASGPVYSIDVLEELQIDGRRTTQRELSLGWRKWCHPGEGPSEGSLRREGFWIKQDFLNRGGIFVFDGVAHDVGLAYDVSFEEAELVITSYFQSVDYVAAMLGKRVADLDLRSPFFVRKSAPDTYAISIRYRDGKYPWTHSDIVLVQRGNVFEVRGP